MSEYSVRIKAVIVALAMNAGIFAACAQAQTHNHTRGQTGDQTGDQTRDQTRGQTESRSAQSRFILEIGNRAISLLRTKQISEADRTARFGELLQTGFDLDYIGRFVLGRHWRAASDPQRAAYLDLFSQFVVKTYASRLQGYSGESFAIVSERVAGIKDSVVRTRIGRPGGGAAIDADWRVRKYHDSYRIVDVMVAGISMVVTQRQEFDAVIRRVGIDGLIAELRSRTGNHTTATANN